MDYANRRRLKIWGRATITVEPSIVNQLTIPDYPAVVERGILITIEAMSWNCPQHISPKYSTAEVEAQAAPLKSNNLRIGNEIG